MKKKYIFLIVAVLGFAVSGCVYDFVAPAPAPPLDGGGNGETTVSFTSDMIPIFQNKCTACHKPGGVEPTPDLTADKAYNSLHTSTYLNLTTPEESYLYVHLYSDANAHSQKKFTAAEALTVLTWIQEGAQNN